MLLRISQNPVDMGVCFELGSVKFSAEKNNFTLWIELFPQFLDGRREV